jgi:hypothetical protein
MSRRRYKQREVHLTADQMAFLDGLFSAFDDLPDGAWGACCVDSVRECGEFKRFDPHEVWLAWCFQRGDSK